MRRSSTEEDDSSLALSWAAEREPSMLLPEGPPSDAFDGLLNQWLMSAVQSGEEGQAVAPMEVAADLTPSMALPLDGLEPLPTGTEPFSTAGTADALDPFSSRLSSLLQLNPYPTSSSHQAKNSWEDIPIFNPQFTSPETSPPSNEAAWGQSRASSSSHDQMPAIVPQYPQQGQMLVSSQAAGAQKAVRQPSISSSMLQAAVTTAQWPITTLAAPIAHIASSIGESSKGLLSVPADLARTGARMGTGLVMGAVDGGVDGARRAWRRRNQSEESRQKERARNRRAQKRFREKQKARQLERKDTVDDLRSRLQALSSERTALANRNAILEKVVSLRPKVGENSSVGNPGSLDFADVFGGEDTPQSITLTLSTGPIELAREQLEKLTWSEHVAIWKDHINALAQELEATKHLNEEASDRLLELIQECSTLSLSLCVINPEAMLRFQMTRLDQPAQPNPFGGAPIPPNPLPPPRSHWQYIEAALALDEQQKGGCFESRRVFLGQLGEILRQRGQLHALATKTCQEVGLTSKAGGLELAEESHSLLEAMEALAKLQRNLREEQKLIVQRMIVFHQCTLKPRQAALKLVLSWPWYPDTLAIIEAAAVRSGTEPTSASLLGLGERPTRTAA